MRRRISLLLPPLLALLFSEGAQASDVVRTDCERSGSAASCKIYLDGDVKAGERLYISRVFDRDTLTGEGHVLGSTGTFLGRAFHAGFFPRVYPLDAIRGAHSPVLSLEVQGGLLHAAGLPAGTEVKVIDETFPLWQILGSSTMEILSFAFLANLCFYLLLWQRRRISDGWLYPRDEMRSFFGALAAYLLLRHEVTEVGVPLVWPERSFLFAQRTALFVMLWSVNMLLLSGRFSDKSSIERELPLAPSKSLHALAHAALVFSLVFLAAHPSLSERGADLLLTAPLLPLLFAQERALRSLEWRRILKRSSRSPVLFHLGLIALPCGALLTVAQAWLQGFADQKLFEDAGWSALLLAGLRMTSQRKTREKGLEVTAECRRLLKKHSDSARRLEALCSFIAAEWGAARVSMISVDFETGLVLNSAGPDAIPEEARSTPRRLGPFLRRACKHGHMLYAPVADELGRDLQNEGLKHSSLAIPLFQDGSARAVLCVMADEGQRIPPSDATQLEMLADTLSLEILSAVAQEVAEHRTRHLLEIARSADVLAVEGLDLWGHLRSGASATSRLVLGGDCIPAGPFFDQLRRSPMLGKVLASYRAETRRCWVALAAAFEFLPKDGREDFWVISPREFSNPLLKELGPERAGALLATLLERQARAIACKPIHSVLGYCGVRLAFGMLPLQRSSWHFEAVELDSEGFAALLGLRQAAAPGTALFSGNPHAIQQPGSGFSCRVRPWDGAPGKSIFSILHVAADKKEIRRLESLAAEKARVMPRKIA